MMILVDDTDDAEYDDAAVMMVASLPKQVK